MEDESKLWFTKAEKLFTVINNEISFKEGCNLLFNMLLHYNLMLYDFSSSPDDKKRENLVRKLQTEAKVGNNQVLLKRALVSIQLFFIESDPVPLLDKFLGLLNDISQPNSGISSPSYIGIMLKYFVANLSSRIGNMEQAAHYSQELLNNDIRAYYGHIQSDSTVEPMLIILNHKFDEFITALNSNDGVSDQGIAAKESLV